MAKKHNQAALGDHSLLWQAAFWGLAIILFYPPFFRGLFFNNEQQTTLILISIVFLLTWLWKLSLREISFLNRPIDFCALGLFIAYLISAFGAANYRLAVAEIIKVCLYFLTFWLCANLPRADQNIKKIMQVIYCSGIGIAAAGILTALGFIHINDGFVAGRIYSTLQYPNALAIYLLAIVFLGLYLWDAGSDKYKYLYSLGNFTLLFAFLGANSRGAFLILPIVTVLYFVFAAVERRYSIIVHYILTFLAVMIASYRFIPEILAGQTGNAGIWLLAGLLASVLAQAFLQLIASKQGFKEFNYKKFGIVIAVIFIVLVCVLLYLLFYQADLAAKILPEQLVERIQGIDFNDRNSQERLYWAGEALTKIVKQRPLFGLGGGAWQAAYQSFQGYGYSSTQVHNDWVQLWAESGTVGFLLWIGLWLFFLITAWKNYKKGSAEQRLIQIALTAGALAIGGHAMIDFDLALSAVAMILWSMFGLTRAMDKNINADHKILEPKKFVGYKTLYYGAVGIFTALAVMVSSSLLLGNSYAQKAIEAVQNNNPEQAMRNFERAALLDPFQASFEIDLARLYLAKGDKDKALQLGEAAVKKDRYNWRIYANLTEIYWQTGDINKAVAAMETAHSNARWQTAANENLAKVYASAGLNYLQQGKKEEAEEVFAKAANLPELITTRVSALTPKEKWLWETLRKPLEVTPPVKLNAGMALYFLNEFDRAAALLNEAAEKEELQAEAYLWLALIKDKQHSAQEATKLLQQSADMDPDIAANFKMIRELPLLR